MGRRPAPIQRQRRTLLCPGVRGCLGIFAAQLALVTITFRTLVVLNRVRRRQGVANGKPESMQDTRLEPAAKQARDRVVSTTRSLLSQPHLSTTAIPHTLAALVIIPRTRLRPMWRAWAKRFQTESLLTSKENRLNIGVKYRCRIGRIPNPQELLARESQPGVSLHVVEGESRILGSVKIIPICVALKVV
jgi:hypothetical protein